MDNLLLGDLANGGAEGQGKEEARNTGRVDHKISRAPSH